MVFIALTFSSTIPGVAQSLATPTPLLIFAKPRKGGRKMGNNARNYREKYKRHYGIEFGREYAVHHIDGDRSNDDIANLILLPLALHSKYHHYTTMMQIYAQDGFCFDLTYSGMSVRSLRFAQLDDLRVLFRELQPWIEYKHLADMGCYSYPTFKRRDK